MIYVTIFTDSKTYCGFHMLGHAGYAEYGQDIICAGVSALAINTINSIETFTDDEIEVLAEEETGLLQLSFVNGISQESQLLMKSFVLGIEGISKENSSYIKIVFQEV